MARKSSKKQIVRVKKKSLTGPRKAPTGLVRDLRSLIEQTREAVGRSVNSALVVLYWQVGRRIRKDILKDERAEYGREIVQTVSAQLVAEYGSGFSRPNLFRMLRFAEVFPHEQIVSTLSRQLSWSHFVLGRSGIRVAAYMTELPPRDLLRKKLHDAVRLARAGLEAKDVR